MPVEKAYGYKMGLLSVEIQIWIIILNQQNPRISLLDNGHIYIYIYVIRFNQTVMLYKENGKKNTSKWMKTSLLLNINSYQPTRFDRII